ncbi:MAG: hypothetical protein RSE07_02070 [Oscillospiraceae bacterium]
MKKSENIIVGKIENILGKKLYNPSWLFYALLIITVIIQAFVKSNRFTVIFSMTCVSLMFIYAVLVIIKVILYFASKKQS